MKIEFDDDKDSINQNKHGFSLAFGQQILASVDAVIVETFRLVDEEERFKAIASVDGKLHTCVFVWRGDVARMISVRRSNANEQRDFDRYSSQSG
jgi:uncharacterized protein